MRLALKYAVLCAVATAANVGSQDVVIRAYVGAFDVLLSVAVGTGVGLFVKYALDSRFIFRFRARNVRHDSQTFVLYSLMGIGTTGIFWGFEFAFHQVFQTKELRYLGGVMGLTIGYFAKCELDKRFVFQNRVA